MLPVRIYRSNEPFWPHLTGGPGLLDRPFDRLLNDAFGPASGSAVEPWKTDIWEDDQRVYVEMEVPGFSDKDVDVDVDKGVLTVKGHQQEDHNHKDRTYHLAERREGRFSRSFRLGKNVDGGKVSAKLKDGILTIELPKRAEAKSRRVEVKAG